jgi:hypothetical protein
MMYRMFITMSLYPRIMDVLAFNIFMFFSLPLYLCLRFVEIIAWHILLISMQN